MPSFVAEEGFAWSGRGPFRERCPSRAAVFRLGLDAAEVCRRAVVAPRVLSTGPFGRFGVRVVALRFAPPDPPPLAAFDLPRERSELVVLALMPRDLPPDRSAVAGAVLPRLGVPAARRVPARSPASRFLCVDARAESPRVAVRLLLAGTSVISTSPSSDTGRSGTRRPSSSGPRSPSSAS